MSAEGKTVQDVYSAFRIMPNLQLHQLRVAAVANLIVDNLQAPIDKNAVVRTALFHDMGNIVKFDLGRFPEFLEPEGKEYWEGIQQEFFTKYGKHQHDVSVAIAKEIGLSEKEQLLVRDVDFSKLEETRDMDSMERKITEYADLRVGPHGILPMKERIDEAHKRYSERHMHDEWPNEDFEALAKAAEEVEKQIFGMCSIRPEDITNEVVEPIVEKLRGYKVS